MLRVLHVINDTNIGGAGRYLLTFLEHYDRERLRVQVLCPAGSLLADRCRELGVQVFPSASLAGDRSFAWSGLVSTIGEISDLIKREKIQVVHTHASFIARLAARRAGVDVVYTRHRLDWGGGKRGIKGWAREMLNRATSRRVIAISQAVREALLAEGTPADRIELIYNGIDVEKLRKEASRWEGREGLGLVGSPVVGMVGRLEPEKGHRCFLEAAARVSKDFPGAVFLVVGDGSLGHKLREQAHDLGISDSVVFTGFRDDVPGLISAMDVLVMPSLTEAFGFSLVEGMALGRPCVASAVGGILEIAEDGRTALLVPPGDAEAVAEKVESLLRDKDAASEMGKRAAEEVERRFSARVMAEKITALYESVNGAG
ncbi:MAG: glycosyltransferase [Firmicutes bacterium]|nr:glycosyltransferase [Bacillota bacterium]